MIEHWVHIRCAGIRHEQYTYTWTFHLHRESRLTTHTDITPPLQTQVQSPYHSPPTPPQPKTDTRPSHFPCSHRICKAQTQSYHPLTPPPSPPTPPRHIHILHIPPTPLTPRRTLNTIPEPRVPPSCPALTTTTPAFPSTSHHNTLSAYTHETQITIHASQSQQPPHPQQPHRQTKDDHMTTYTTQGHRPSSKSENNLIILQININGIKNKLEELKLLIHDTHADIITIQETKLTPKANTPKVHNFTTVRADR